jgi:hypothetical protein
MAAEGIVAQKKRAEEILRVSCSLILDSGVMIKPWPSHALRGCLAEHWSEFEAAVARKVGLMGEPIGFEIGGAFGFILPLKTSDSQGWYLAGVQSSGTLESLQQLLSGNQLKFSSRCIRSSSNRSSWMRPRCKSLGRLKNNAGCENSQNT